MDLYPRIPGRRLLQSPGPTPIPDAVLQAMCGQPFDHGDPRLDAFIASCEHGLKRLLQTTTADVFLYASNGHGVWEAAVENLCGPGDTVLIPATGHFSEQWALQAEALGRRVQRTPWREGHPIDADEIEQLLRDDRAHTIRAVFVVHTDTSSGITSEIAPLRRAIDRAGHPALLVADVVASLGAAPFAMDELGVDVALGASQKGLMCPPGVGILAVSAKAMAAAEANTAPRCYWDWVRRKSEFSYRKFCGTAPQNLLMGMDAALGLIFQEGLQAVWSRHAALTGAVHAAVEGWAEGGALGFFAKTAECRSNSVTTITVPAGTDVDAIRKTARERFQVAFAGALGPLQGRGFRIAHLGDSNPAMVLGAIAGIEAALEVHGIPIGGGGTRRAVMALAAR